MQGMSYPQRVYSFVGQAVYFSFFSAERAPNAISRYINETRRVYGVVEMRLAEQRAALMNASVASFRNEDSLEPHFIIDEDTIQQERDIPESRDELEEAPVWLVGNSCSIADLSFLTWANVVDRIGIDLETEFPVPILF
jgi:glutathione S-transferase